MTKGIAGTRGTCKEKGCTDPAQAREMCVSHYGKWNSARERERGIVQRGFRLDEDLVRAVKLTSLETGRSMDSIVTDALVAYFGS